MLELGFSLLGFIQATPEVPLWLRSIQTAADIFQKVVAGSALIIGGLFAYYKFFREQPYVSRLQPTISGTVARRDGTIYLRAAASVKNIGQARVNLTHEYTGLRVLTRTTGPADWSPYYIEDVFEEQDYVDAGETIGEPVWVEMPEEDKVALRLDFYVAESEISGWLAREVVNLVAEVDNKQESEQIGLPAEQQADVLTELKERIGKWLSSRA